MSEPEFVRIDHLPLTWRALLAAALEARQHAYASYSQYPVGAAVRTATGRIFSGCNVENASTGLTVCAERVAIWNAVSQGEHMFNALVVVTSDGAAPCGACRQVMSEFASDMPVLIADTEGRAWITSLKVLLPEAFPRVTLHKKLGIAEEQ